ncbi:MAG: hypothetical protein AAGF23_20380 [Acidobacteriota bacterium]
MLGDRLARQVLVHDGDSTYVHAGATVTRPRELATVLGELAGELGAPGPATE